MHMVIIARHGGYRSFMPFFSTVLCAILGVSVGLLQPAYAIDTTTWTGTDTTIYTTNLTKKVGIGTSTPQADLSVQGKRAVIGNNALIGNYNSQDAVIEINGSQGASYINFISQLGGMVFGSSIYDNGQNGLFSWKSPFVIMQDAKEALRIAPSGNIGIGTTNPSSLLHLKSSGTTLRLEDAAGEPKLSFLDEVAAERAFIQLRDTGSDQDALIIRAGNDDIKFRTQAEDTDAQTTLFVGGAGSVGIGTTTPGSNLDVVSTGNTKVLIHANDAINDRNPELELKAGNTDAAGHSVLKFSKTAGSLYESLQFQNAAGTSVMTIDGVGAVGIGTISPQYLLDVAGFARFQGVGGTDFIVQTPPSDVRLFSTQNVPLNIGTAGNSSMLSIMPSGNVGIGTTAPRQLLEVHSTQDPVMNIHKASVGELTTGITGTAGNSAAIINTNTQSIQFRAGQDGTSFPGSGSTALAIHSNGYVGIGTNDVPKPLTINAGGNDAIYMTSNDSHNWYMGPNVGGPWFGIYNVSTSKLKMKIDTAGNMCLGSC